MGLNKKIKKKGKKNLHLGPGVLLRNCSSQPMLKVFQGGSFSLRSGSYLMKANKQTKKKTSSFGHTQCLHPNTDTEKARRSKWIRIQIASSCYTPSQSLVGARTFNHVSPLWLSLDWIFPDHTKQTHSSFTVSLWCSKNLYRNSTSGLGFSGMQQTTYNREKARY